MLYKIGRGVHNCATYAAQKASAALKTLPQLPERKHIAKGWENCRKCSRQLSTRIDCRRAATARGDLAAAQIGYVLPLEIAAEQKTNKNQKLGTAAAH